MITRRLNLKERDAFTRWQAYYYALLNESAVDLSETHTDKRGRVARLERDPEAWFRYYFPAFCTAEPAPFHRAATRRLIANDRWYEVRAWSRELAKTSRAMMEVLYLALTGKIKNMLLVSNSKDKAEDLIAPFKLTLESSARIINDYGTQVTQGSWEADKFVAACGCSFRAIGAGQSPRGVKNKEARPDFILVDDIDTDEETRNPERIKQKWEWFERALFPTLSVSGNHRVLFNGNIIAKDCCITRAGEKADKFDIVNIRDKEGKSSWPEKNTEEDIDRMLSMISTASAQQEYFNNPLRSGDIFTEMTYGKCPPLSKLRFAVCYGDPSPSNKVRSKGASHKCVSLVGVYEGRYYVYKTYLDQVTNDTYLGWFYDIQAYVGDKCPVYYYNENNALQDPFWEQVLVPLLVKKAETMGTISIAPDARAKMDKFARIEATLEPLNRTGRLVLNEDEKGNPHMQRLEEQFTLIAPSLPAPADGPDDIEGAVWIINSKLTELRPDAITIGVRHHSKKRY